MSSLTDFSDRLSPMLVKELRQGLRARTFVSVFLGLQVFMLLILLSAIGSTSPDRAGTTISGIIFVFFSLAVLVIQPLRGITAVSSEMKGRTIDLMILTRLSAWRIVFGKWVALVGQSALLFAAIVPYLILRYFFGQMNLFAELLLLGCVFLGSMLLTAITVGLSASPSLLVRGILPVFGTPFLVIAILGICLGGGLNEVVEFFTLSEPEAQAVFAIGLGMATFLAWSAIDFSATLIAPHAENRATPRRLVAMGLTLLATSICLVAPVRWAEWTLIPLAVCLTPVIITTLTEPMALLPVVCRPFARRGWPGRILGRFLYPGWPSGVLFLVPLSLLTLVCAYRADPRDEPSILMACWFGSLLFPAVCVLPFQRKLRSLSVTYTIILVASIIFTFVLALLGDAMNDEDFLWLFSWLPAVHIVLSNENLGSDKAILLGSILYDALLLAVLVTFSLTRQPEITRIEKAAIDEPDLPEKAITPAPES